MQIQIIKIHDQLSINFKILLYNFLVNIGLMLTENHDIDIHKLLSNVKSDLPLIYKNKGSSLYFTFRHKPTHLYHFILNFRIIYDHFPY